MKRRYNISIDEKVKEDFDRETEKLGLSSSAAIELFMRAVNGQHKIPFTIGNYESGFADTSERESDTASA